MKRKCLENEECAVARSLDVVGDWWSLLIVRDAFMGHRRFGEFQTSLGVAKNILTDRLRKLVDRGVLESVPASDGSAFHEYRLTKKGEGLFIVIMALKQWGECSLAPGSESGMALVDRKKREPVRPLVLRAADGRTLGPGDVEFIHQTSTNSSSRKGR